MIWINCQQLFAQLQISAAKQILVDSGFENIRVKKIRNTAIISYENNIHRNKSAGLVSVIDKLSGFAFDSLRIITLVNDIPIITTHFIANNGNLNRVKLNSLGGSYNTDEDWDILRDQSAANSHVNKVDLVFYPQFSMKNVLLSQIYEVQFNIAPALEVSLWRGMKFTGQVIFPVTNHYVFGDEGDQIRSGFITLAQEFRLPHSTLGRVVAGRFNSDRYGFDGSITKYLFKDRAYIKLNGGYTGNYQYRSREWFRNDLSTLTGFIYGGYFIDSTNLQVDGSFGHYLNGENGFRGDCTRYWGEIAIGFFALVSGGHFNGGFHFTIPIGQKRYPKNRSFQFRAPSYFDWEYNAGTDSYYGAIYKTQPNEGRVEQFFNPNLIIKNLLK
jgi:hypothetical protein